jgi:metallo-beta-lactamase class B
MDVMDGWDQPASPRRIHGNTWYVGTCGLTALLVTSSQGHVLIDGAGAAAGPLIAANIRALGLDPTQVRYLLNSHEHADHAGGLAHLQQVTGAPLLARQPAVDALRRGHGDRSDPQQREPGSGFVPITNVQAIAADHVVQLGELAIRVHATPGHTPGGTSFSWQSCEQGRCLSIAYTDSVSAISDAWFRYDQHPQAVADFRSGLDTLAAMPCDLHITPHPLASDLFARLAGKADLIDPQACQRYAQAGQRGLSQRLADEAAGRKP